MILPQKKGGLIQLSTSHQKPKSEANGRVKDSKTSRKDRSPSLLSYLS